MVIIQQNSYNSSPVEGPRTIRLAAVSDRGVKNGSALNVNIFGSVRKGDL